VKSLGELFAIGKELWQSLFQPVILIRAVFLKDATVVQFITQHPLCHASGMMNPASLLGARLLIGMCRIVRRQQVYCAILNESEPPDLAFDRPSLKLKDLFTQTTQDNQPQSPSGPSVLDRLRPMFRWSLRSMNGKGGKQSLRDIFYPSHGRVDQTVHLLSEKMQAWRENAQEHGIHVTENDLLSAFIYQVSFPML
jgi:hypothetical protein